MKLTKFALTLLLLLGSTLVLEAKTFSFDQVNTMPRSVEKDYYIWRFLSQNTTTAARLKPSSVMQQPSTQDFVRLIRPGRGKTHLRLDLTLLGVSQSRLKTGKTEALPTKILNMG